MGYTFEGCFSRFAPGLSGALRARWPHARIRTIERPFEGVGLRLPWKMSEEATHQLVHRFRIELPDWSRAFPDTRFAYVLAECFGGHCEYEGYVCQDGRKLLEVPFDPNALGKLMSAIDVKLPEEYYFEPFTRTFDWG